MLIFIAAGIVAIATHPQWTLVVIAYSYLASAFVGMAIDALQAPRRARRQRKRSTDDRRDSAAAAIATSPRV